LEARAMIDITPYKLRRIQKGREKHWEIFKDQEWTSLHQKDLFLLIETAVCNATGKTIRIESASWLAYEGDEEVTHDIELTYQINTYNLSEEGFRKWIESIVAKIEEVNSETIVTYYFQNEPLLGS
jgi:hypothetical protein